MAQGQGRSRRRTRFSHIRLIGLDMEMARGVRAYFDAGGGRHFVHTNGHEHVPDAAIVGRTDGVIALASVFHHGTLPPPKSRHAPVVTYGRFADHMPYVVPDYEAAGKLALEHFEQVHLRHVAFVGVPGVDVSDEMRDGFSTAAQEAGVEAHVNDVNVFSALAHGSPEEKPFLRWLRKLPKPVGLLCPLARLAVFVAMLCERSGVSVPDEIALLAGNPAPIDCALARPELSMIEDSHWQIGYEMARLLDLRMRGRKPESPVVRVAPLRIREAASTSILAIEDSRLRKAILYLREHACGPISVREVVAESGLSRRALELQMQKVLGCTVHQEITRVRIARAKQLLRSSNLPLAEVALACGLEWASSLCTLFTREVGMPPGRYRTHMRQGRSKGIQGRAT